MKTFEIKSGDTRMGTITVRAAHINGQSENGNHWFTYGQEQTVLSLIDALHLALIEMRKEKDQT